ncbi:phosphohistidine phosphatase SixA [Vespertiliibacter pulmonis]|uniref:Phosphohistidine phosphatase SixA n=1 Tax=Vespertiliibacter pulmonis TaxID=1443036 RepID=A0A3N4VST8_9PAST|nr:phosphohistidine phosphatase SixA [Vespertiliibacter pulmonis]QLB20136.1 phosphohistidine phosphatase SixA [Vespertiliibacter pulmonis]RPE86108.1 phosphohistidine phosphatase SixA [Vespertiliibacter pulmonis]
MQIWIMRHGEAGFNSTIDSQRSLTDKGKNMAYKQGKWLANRLIFQGRSLNKIIVSPYLRAKQTLEMLLQGIEEVSCEENFVVLNERIEQWEGITPGGSVENVVNYLDVLQQDGVDNVLIISHLPLVYDLVQMLTLSQQSVHFYPAVIAEISKKGNIGELKWAEFP